RRVLIRFSMLAVLMIAGGVLYLDTNASASGDCAMTVFNKWMACDNSYAGTAQLYAIRTPHCVQTAPSTCPPAAEEFCASLPPWDYAGCCLAASRAACEATISTNYDNRGSSYFSCMGFEGNLGNCVEQMDICTDAYLRA